MAGRLEGEVAIITGAGTGMGESHARRFAKEGAVVVLADVDFPSVEKVANQIKAEGGKALAVKVDVSKKAEVEEMVKKALDAFGKIDILVNNAAIFRGGPAVEFPEEDWDAVLNVNLKGQFLCAQAVGKHMMERKQGRIVNIASVSGHRGGPVQGTAYCASKGGVLTLTKQLAVEWAPYNINVNSVSPSTTTTPMLMKFFEEAGMTIEDHTRWIPLSKVNRPEDMSNAVLFLASSESDTITGQDLTVDGGVTALYWPKGY